MNSRSKPSNMPRALPGQWESLKARVGQIFACLAFCSVALGCGEEARKPNILFVVVDDLGHHDLGFMGSSYYETPNLDSLAGVATVFTQGYATCAVCSPSRASMLTGKFPARHGITDYLGAPYGENWRGMKRHTPLLPPAFEQHLRQEFTTLPEALKEGGYRTFFAGKWHLGGAAQQSLPTDHGFDENRGGYEAGGPYSGGYFSPFNNPYLEDFPEEKGMSLSMKLARETARFMEAHKDSAFFAMLSFYAVHAPLQTSRAKWAHYREKALARGLPEQGFGMERVMPIRLYQDNPVYAGLVEQVDEAVGVVLKKLRELGLAENTVIVFLSDNGGVASGDHYATSNAPLRGGKGYQWEGGIRIPFLISVPWLPAGKGRVETPVTAADLFPTLLDLAGLPQQPQAHSDGTSLLPLLKGGTLPPRPLYWHYPHYGNQGGEPSSMIRAGDWKLIHYWEDGRNELYDLAGDPGEGTNLAGHNPALTDSLFGELERWLSGNGARLPVRDPLFSADSLRQVLDAFQGRTRLYWEAQRMQMLDPAWSPDTDWWGSE